ncbi:hypothetical protein BDF20DRAFT_906473 [Mycotypha africana]|uniref:uncharacterized protein n=1 Tax=Mycotypha africana TaxID=64632 RepID=UPI00230198DD|nr:uncharacterized protein BDF20DRAFT_906473 [Mycotypha africana]KAI8977447.1 hypothetical protein BDF20DRAFT_906473 [Mycotypha africana]
MSKYDTSSPSFENYRKYQLLFIDWVSTLATLINFLSYLHTTYHWQPSTLKLVRSAVTHLHTQPDNISKYSLINDFLLSLVKQQAPLRIHHSKVSLQPAIDYAKSISSSTSTPWSLLQSKMAFLLGVTALLRPSDLARISLDSCKVIEDHFSFQVVAPKETRQRRSIIKDYMVNSHSDPVLCPVRLFQVMQQHPAWSSVATLPSTLFFSGSTGSSISSNTISKWLHRHYIRKITSESTTLRSFEDIVALGNWHNSSVFDNHYRRNHMLSVNFTSTLLTSTGTGTSASGLGASVEDIPDEMPMGSTFMVVGKNSESDDNEVFMDAVDSLD